MTNLRVRLTYANVIISTLCLFLLLGGGAAYAASQLGKNSVGTKQLKKNSVTTAKIKKAGDHRRQGEERHADRDPDQSSTLGTVPSAQTANSIVPPENWHMVGAAGEPGFENSGETSPASPPFAFEGAGFYKDREGMVHLKGLVKGGSGGHHLPPSAGYRPASRKGTLQAHPLRGRQLPPTTDRSHSDHRPRGRAGRRWRSSYLRAEQKSRASKGSASAPNPELEGGRV